MTDRPTDVAKFVSEAKAALEHMDRHPIRSPIHPYCNARSLLRQAVEIIERLTHPNRVHDVDHLYEEDA